MSAERNETGEGTRVAVALAAAACRACFDTGLVFARGEAVRCALCFIEDKSLSTPAVRLAVALWSLRDKGHKTDAQTFEVARVLTHAAAAAPFTNEAIASHLKLSERKVKDIVRTLRREWLLPIGSSRQLPYGYYWILTPKQFLDWSRVYRAQAIDELVTLHRLQRANFAELSGQGSFDFAETVKRELEESL